MSRVVKSTFDLLASCEGIRYKPYLCPKGVPTIGIGNTYYEDGTKVKLTDSPITMQRAEKLFYNIAKEKEASINKLLKAEINQNQFDVVFSICWQYGAGFLAKSLFMKQVNKDPNNFAEIRHIFNLMEYHERRDKEFLHYTKK